MRVIFFGSGSFGLPVLRWLVASQHEVVAVVTQPDRPAGRGRRMTRTPIGQFADEAGLALLPVEDVNAPAVIAELLALQARLGIVVAFGQKIGRAILDGLPAGCINLHASLLPRLRGAAPINWAIIRGEQHTGLTVFQLTDRMDAGDILVQLETAIKPAETAAELHDRLAEMGPAAIEQALRLYQNTDRPLGRPQDERLATRAPKLTKHDGRICFSWPARELANRICGLWPWPGAACTFHAAQPPRREKVILARAIPCEQTPQCPAGTITEQLDVATGQGVLQILELKPTGGRLMPWQDFVNGRHVQPGDRFSG